MIHGGRLVQEERLAAVAIQTRCDLPDTHRLWGTVTVRVVVAGELPAPSGQCAAASLHASPGLVGFGTIAYRRRSEDTSRLLDQLFERLHEEEHTVAYTMEDFRRDYIKKHFPLLAMKEQEILMRTLPAALRLLESMPPEVRLAGLSPEERLAGLSEEEIRKYLDKTTASPKTSIAQTASEEVTDIGREVRWQSGNDGQEVGPNMAVKHTRPAVASCMRIDISSPVAFEKSLRLGRLLPSR